MNMKKNEEFDGYAGKSAIEGKPMFMPSSAVSMLRYLKYCTIRKGIYDSIWKLKPKSMKSS
jgi:hypothetical protein